MGNGLVRLIRGSIAISDLAYLGGQIGLQPILGQELVDDRERACGRMAADERIEPGEDEEDLAFPLQLRERGEGRAQETDRQR